MKKGIALLLCLTMMLGLCAAALAEDKKAENEKTKEDVFEESILELLGKTAEMSDEEIREAFRKAAEESDIKITDKQLDKIVSACRLLEKMNADDVSERIKLIAENFYNGLVEAPDKFLGWLENVGSGKYTLEDAKNSLFHGFGKAAGALSDFFSSIADFFNGKTKKQQ